MIERVVRCVAVVLGALLLSGSALRAQQAGNAGSVSGVVDAALSREEILMREVELRLQSDTADESERPDTAVFPPAPMADSSADSNSYHQTLRAIKDSVLVLTRKGANNLLESFAGQTRNSRERGYGGGLGPTLGVHAVSMKPVNELIANSSQLSDAGFAMNSYEIFVMMGGTAYGGLGNGVRIGGGGFGGQRSFTALYNDTTWGLQLSVSWGGILLERAFVRSKLNYFLGGFCGGGKLSLKRNFQSGGIFNLVDIDQNSVTVAARFVLLEGHGGFTYSLLPWMHLGMELSAPLMYSPGGFKSPGDIGLTNSFISVSPGLRLRLMFGNIG
jgi:hypothetical protein